MWRSQFISWDLVYKIPKEKNAFPNHLHCDSASALHLHTMMKAFASRSSAYLKVMWEKLQTEARWEAFEDKIRQFFEIPSNSLLLKSPLSSIIGGFLVLSIMSQRSKATAVERNELLMEAIAAKFDLLNDQVKKTLTTSSTHL